GSNPTLSAILSKPKGLKGLSRDGKKLQQKSLIFSTFWVLARRGNQQWQKSYSKSYRKSPYTSASVSPTAPNPTVLQSGNPRSVCVPTGVSCVAHLSIIPRAPIIFAIGSMANPSGKKSASVTTPNRQPNSPPTASRNLQIQMALPRSGSSMNTSPSS